MNASQTVAEIAAAVGARVLRGDGQRQITDVAPLESATATDLTFLANSKYTALVETTRAGAIIIPEGFEIPAGWPADPALLGHANPYLAFAKALTTFRPEPSPPPPGLHPTAVVAKSARLGADVHIGAHCVVGEDVQIGDRSVVLSGCVIGDDVAIGTDCRIGPHVSILRAVQLGNRVRIDAQSAVGTEGFGYAVDAGVRQRIPQVGTVIIEDDVEIGAGVTVDRATMGETRIGARTKIDNLVQIAHNVIIGTDCVIVSQVGISGSTKLGRHVTLAGQVGLVGHIELGDNVIVAAQSGVPKDLPAGSVVLGSPALDIRRQRRILSVMANLPELVKTIRNMERRIADLEHRLASRDRDDEKSS